MKISLTDFEDTYCLIVNADPHDPKVAEAAEELNSFWSGADDRLATAATFLKVEEKSPEALWGAAAITICSAAVAAALGGDDVRDDTQLRRWFAQGQEGYPLDFSEYGIHIEGWSITLPDTVFVCLEILE